MQGLAVWGFRVGFRVLGFVVLRLGSGFRGLGFGFQGWVLGGDWGYPQKRV